MFQNRKGFTLIELLIVITIIGILAVAFLPTLLGAPAKGRDTQRIADLQKLQKVMVNADLEGKAFPATSRCIGDNEVDTPPKTKFVDYVASLGGALPTQPRDTDETLGCKGKYAYVAEPTGYKFALYTMVENLENANTNCAADLTAAKAVVGLATPIDEDETLCYAILTQ